MIPNDKQRNEEEHNEEEETKVSIPIKKYSFPCLDEEEPIPEDNPHNAPLDWKDELITIAAAVQEAKDAFEKFLTDRLLDPGYWRLQVEVEFLDSTLTEVLRRLRVEEVA